MKKLVISFLLLFPVITFAQSNHPVENLLENDKTHSVTLVIDCTTSKELKKTIENTVKKGYTIQKIHSVWKDNCTETTLYFKYISKKESEMEHYSNYVPLH